MKKIEYIHLHALMVVIFQHLEEVEDFPDGALPEYGTAGISAAAIHRRKERHRKAVLLVSASIVRGLEAQEQLDSEQSTRNLRG